MKKHIAKLVVILTLSTSLQAHDFIPWKLDLLLDALNYTSELGNIIYLTKQNEMLIKSASALSGTKNIGLSLYNILEACIAIKLSQDVYAANSGSNSSEKKTLDIFSIIKIIFSIQNALFAIKDKEIFINAKKIASLNKDFKKYKQKPHMVWLTVNFVLPYLALMLKRLIYNKSSLENLLCYKDAADCNLHWNQDTRFLCILHLITDCSEYVRRSTFYRDLASQINAGKTVV